MTRIRQKEILKRRKRRVKLKKWKSQLASAKTIKERERLIALILKREPWFKYDPKQAQYN